MVTCKAQRTEGPPLKALRRRLRPLLGAAPLRAILLLATSPPRRSKPHHPLKIFLSTLWKRKILIRHNYSLIQAGVGVALWVCKARCVHGENRDWIRLRITAGDTQLLPALDPRKDCSLLYDTHWILLTEVHLSSKTWDIQAAHPPHYSLHFIFLSPVCILWKWWERTL